MIYGLEFHYRIEKGAKLGTNQNGDYCETYACITLGECETEQRSPEKEKEAHEVQVVNLLASELCINPKYIVPVTKEEYEADADEDE